MTPIQERKGKEVKAQEYEIEQIEIEDGPSNTQSPSMKNQYLTPNRQVDKSAVRCNTTIDLRSSSPSDLKQISLTSLNSSSVSAGKNHPILPVVIYSSSPSMQ